jgi:hypothetical protein
LGDPLSNAPVRFKVSSIQYPVGRKVFEEEFGYSSKEEAFYNECEKRGNRWRKEIASDYSSLNAYLQEDRFHALVIVGESLSNLAVKVVLYLEKIEAGPKESLSGSTTGTSTQPNFTECGGAVWFAHAVGFAVGVLIHTAMMFFSCSLEKV